MGWMRYPVSILILLFLAAVITLDASAQDTKSWQDQRGNATPVLMGKNVEEAEVGQEATGLKTRLLSPMVRWELDLKDSLDRSVEMEMYQSNDALFGKGRIMAEGIEQNVSASGAISGNKLDLDILSEDLSLFRFSLTMNGKSIYGDYHIYSARFITEKGIAMGKIE
jgi:hypothetical protein